MLRVNTLILPCLASVQFSSLPHLCPPRGVCVCGGGDEREWSWGLQCRHTYVTGLPETLGQVALCSAFDFQRETTYFGTPSSRIQVPLDP